MTSPSRDFYLEIPLGSIGSIRVPRGAFWRHLGQAVAGELRHATGLAPPVCEAASGPEGTEAPHGHRILIGTVHTNPEIAWLYRRKHTLVDDFYPGAAGWVIQSVHNPSNLGYNAVIIGLSDPGSGDEVLHAFREWVAGSEGVLGYVNLVRTRLVVPGLAPAEQRRWKRKARAAFRANTGRDALERGIESGLIYALTGQAAYLELFIYVLRHYHGLVRRAGGEWEFEHMLFPYAWIWRLAWLWDMVEESPLLGDGDREEGIAILRGLADYTARLVYFRDPRMREPAIRQNHPTFAALSLFFAGRYFQKYYDDHSRDSALETARLIFDGQRDSYKPDDDANGYCWLAPAHLLIHDLANDDFRFIEDGHLRRICEYAELTTDNLGAPVGFGDVTRYYPPGWCYRELRHLLTAAAAFYRDGSCRRLLSTIPRESFDLTPRHGEMGNYLVDSVGHHALDLESGDSVPAPGFQCAPLTGAVHRLIGGQGDPAPASAVPAGGTPPRVPERKSYDKIVLRSGYGSADDYLLIDGIAGCVHGHEDAASVIRLTWRDRMWLAEGDYIRSLPKFHNALVSICNGESGPMPKLASLEYLHRTGESTFLQVRISDYNGVHWRRNIVWRPGNWFLFVDSAELLEEADYVVSLRWRLLGKVGLSARTTDCRQDAVRFRLTHGDSSIRSLSTEPPREIRIPYGPFHRDYPHAGDPTRILCEERRVARGAVGGRITFFNLLTCGDPDEVGAWNLRKAGEQAARLSARRGSEDWVVHEGPVSRAGWGADSELTLVAEDSLRLIHCRSVRIGRRVAGFSSPVFLELLRESRTARVVADPDTVVSGSLLSPAGLLQAGESILGSDLDARDWPQLEPTEPMRESMIEDGPDVRPSGSGKVAIETLTELDGPPSAMAWSARSDRLFVVKKQRRCITVNRSGRSMEFARFSRPVSFLRPIDLEGTEQLVVGGAGFVSLLDSSGAIQWKVGLPPSHYRIQRVNDIAVAALEPGAPPSILVATDGWLVHCLGLSGVRRWVTQIHHHAARNLLIGDVDGDGRMEILVGTEYHTSDLLEWDGRVRWTITGGPEFIALAFCDLDGDGLLESVYGAESGTVCAVHSRTGAILWKANLGDRAHLARVMKVGDETILIVGSISGEIVRIDGCGRKVWRRNLGAEILAMERSGDPGSLIAVTRSGEILRLDSNGKISDRADLGIPLAGSIPTGGSGRLDRLLLVTPTGRLLRASLPVPA